MSISSDFKNSISNNSFLFIKNINWNNSSIDSSSPIVDKFLSSGELLTLKDGEISGLKAGTYLKLIVANSNIVYIDMSEMVNSNELITNNQIAKGTISRDRINEDFEKSFSEIEFKLSGINTTILEQIEQKISQYDAEWISF